MKLLEVKNLDKRFGQQLALSQVSLTICPGEVHALVGENGAGKSTFIKIITGVYEPCGGQIRWVGEPETISDPNHARKLGINVVYQDRHLIPSFTGLENLFLGLEYPRKKWGIGVDWKAMGKRAEVLQQELGIRLHLNRMVRDMSPPEKTMLEIMRAMMHDCRLLILDEPTASLTAEEAEHLFQLIQKLVAKRTAILYVSHRLEEVLRISDRITVLCNGQVAGTLAKSEAGKERLISLMTNSEAKKTALVKKGVFPDNPDILKVEQLATIDGKVRSASLRVRRGEITGIFGLTGSGRTELLEAIFGTREIKSGKVSIANEQVVQFSPKQSLSRGVILIPEDRRADALIMNMRIRENMTLPVLDQFSNGWKLAETKERSHVALWMETMKVRAFGTEQPVHELSGGNQQKVVFAKALLSKPCLFLCDEPTQAVDVMTRDEIHRLLIEQVIQQNGVLYVSSDLQELLDISDTIVVLHDGQTVAELENSNLTSEQILQICYNQRKESSNE